ncbi:GspH/FimT family pseudopilin [Vibrio taketomensis]|uniref:GspH/FimT family pseudopilin n=1 Tax=Vibrio taketomensis TaxID=2572923 RepID=UPI001E363D29|nr:GspH/FimT family pseudopilin [Vibrio taketomensis]
MRKWEIPRGFTLLELIITVSILSVLVMIAIPSFQSVKERSQTERLATEMTGFFLLARSEAVLQNKTLYGHIDFPANGDHVSSNWSIQLTDSSIPLTGNVIQEFSGAAFRGLTVHHNYSSDQIAFEGIRGRAKSGTFKFFPSNDSGKQLEIRTSNPPGRVKVCATSEGLYGYKKC